MKVIRVLQIVDSLNISSGVMSVIMNWYRNIDRNKVQFDFMVNFPKERSHEKEIIEMGGRIYYMPSPSIKNVKSYLSSINDFFRENNTYKIIHLHTPTLGFIYHSIAKKYGIKNRITHSHSTMYSDSVFKIIRNYMLCLPLNKLSTTKLACSQTAGEFLFGKNKEFIVINNAIDCRKFSYNKKIRKKVREELNINDELVIGHIGRIEKEKNHTFILDIFKQLHDKNSNSILVLVGEGTLRSEIESKAIEIGIREKVYFLGVRTDVHRILQAIDILLFPSLFEGMPMVCIEAQGAGARCFVSDTITKAVDISELINFLSLKADADEWAQKILETKGESIRSGKVNEIKKAKFDIRDVTKQLELTYVQLYNR